MKFPWVLSIIQNELNHKKVPAVKQPGLIFVFRNVFISLLQF